MRRREWFRSRAEARERERLGRLNGGVANCGGSAAEAAGEVNGSQDVRGREVTWAGIIGAAIGSLAGGAVYPPLPPFEEVAHAEARLCRAVGEKEWVTPRRQGGKGRKARDDKPRVRGEGGGAGLHWSLALRADDCRSRNLLNFVARRTISYHE